MMIILNLFCFAMIVVCNAVCDVLANFYGKSVFTKWDEKFWNPKVSYVNKWKNGDEKQGEKYLGSSTIFSLFTDGWHRVKAGMVIFIIFTAVTYTPIFAWYVNVLIYLVMWYAIFECSLKLLRKK